MTGQYDDQLQRIRQKLDRARSTGASCFGSSSHQFVLGPCLSDTKIQDFEGERGVRLPECFRSFLEFVGHAGPGRFGGAGPYYGLLPLDAWDEFPSWIMDQVPADFLSLECPLVPGPNELDPADDIPDDEWDAEMQRRYGGVLTLGSQGCTYMTGLVVSGAARGRVVYLDAQQNPPYIVRDATFLDWYERWLDELLGGYRMFWFGYGPAGKEQELLELIMTTDDLVLIREAIVNLGNLPLRTPRTWEILAPLLVHPNSDIRRVAVTTYRHAPEECRQEVKPLRNDPDDGVRAAAQRTWDRGWRD